MKRVDRLSAKAQLPGLVPSQPRVRLGVHDASRLEWVASIPLNLVDLGLRYNLELSVELPHNVYAPHDGWAHLQELTRLESPEALDPGHSGDEAVRRAALAVAHSLKRAHEHIAKHCLLFNSLLTVSPPNERVIAAFMTTIHETLLHAESARRRFELSPQDPPALEREKEIADEFISSRLVDWLSNVLQTFETSLLAPDSRFRSEFQALLEPARQRLIGALEEELARRAARGRINPVAEVPDTLVRYIERASQLKKHFQEALFLEQQILHTEHRVRNFIAIFAAAAASIAYFVATNSAALKTISGSMGATAILGALIYAAKDRIKELSKSWLSSQFTRRFGSRTVSVRVPSRIIDSDLVLEEARESFEVGFARQADLLNPHMGQIRRVAILRLRRSGILRGSAKASARLRELGFMGIKHIFRYDLSSVFSRLDDSVKRVSAYDASRRAISVVDVPRHYRFPVTLGLRIGNFGERIEADLVVAKSGIVRMESSVRGGPTSLAAEPARPETDPSEPLPAEKMETAEDGPSAAAAFQCWICEGTFQPSKSVVGAFRCTRCKAFKFRDAARRHQGGLRAAIVRWLRRSGTA